MQMREMARRIATEDYEREKQHQANLTALHAIGPQRRRRNETSDSNQTSLHHSDSTVLHLAQGDGLSTSSLDENSSSTIVSNSSIQNNRLSVISANRLSSLFASNGSQWGLEMAHTNYHQSTNNLALDQQHSFAGSSFSLAQSLKIHRGTLRDVQTVMGRNSRLRRTRTFYRTHWRSSN